MTDRLMPPSGHAVVGHAPGQPMLGEQAGARALGSGSTVLPELAAAPERERSFWRHPAFLVSSILTVLALAAAATWWILTIVNDDSVRVDGLTASVEGGNLHLDWGGPDAEYALYAVAADGEVSDLTQLVRGTEAWIPAAAGVADDSTCFVVRPAAETGEVSLDAATLDGQRGAGVCAADADA
ncbi:hypothetical protein GE115_15950 [Agromyces sp. CFH 90414]|uniref:Uncharacterized protein n=1 Tax=Agromyces agglutinans TaxID=2662258 RepID=A0A6I2FF63_9MICO|nr:hypothetical protein [Agromyces agglutinans]MRG61350.1 hypothetical protein [Agromyces agglutinans]